MQEYKLIKNSQIKTFSDREYVESLSNTKNITMTIELNILISKLKISTFRIMCFSFTSQKFLRFDKNIQFFRLNTTLIAISSVFTNFLFINFERSKVAVVSN